MGEAVRMVLRGLLHPAELYLHFPEHDAGLRLRASADVQRNYGASVSHDDGRAVHAFSQLPAGGLLRSVRVDRRRNFHADRLQLYYPSGGEAVREAAPEMRDLDRLLP